jgi:hypothetical protein
MRPDAARLSGWGPRWGPAGWPPFSPVRWCGHGRPPNLLAAFDAGLGDPDAISQDNGCYNTLEWRGGRWTVLGINELPEP